jgi:RNA polymerase sigma factor (sigma-70 family)
VERWLAALDEGHAEEAWDAFLDQYRGLLFAAIRHYVQDHDDVMDVFTWVCEALRDEDLRRLRSFAGGSAGRARFGTWLVVVVRHLAVDWLRKRDGRLRPRSVEAGLTDLQRRIVEEVFARRKSHVEAFELIRSRDCSELTFGRFLKELATVYRRLTRERGRLAFELCAPPPAEAVEVNFDFIAGQEARRILDAALQSLPEADRVAVQMYVVDEVPAAEVARVVGLRNAKAVYNRVYRALDFMREHVERAGLGRVDL